MEELGYKVPEAIGDPALLLPLVAPMKVRKKYRLGIIPHYIHYDQVNETFKSSRDVLVVNLLNDDIESVIRNINLCEFTISARCMV